MLHFDPDRSSQKDKPEHSLAESSLGGMVRVSFDGLDRTTHEYARSLASLCLLMHARRVVVMDESAQAAVRDLDVFEWNLPYPDDVRPRSFPYFPGDRSKHDEMARLEREYVRFDALPVARVEATIRPLATADREIRHFAKSGQKLFEAVRHR